MFSLNTKGIRDRIDRLSYIPASQGNAQRLKMINLSFSYAKSRDPLTLYILWEYKKIQKANRQSAPDIRNNRVWVRVSIIMRKTHVELFRRAKHD